MAASDSDANGPLMARPSATIVTGDRHLFLVGQGCSLEWLGNVRNVFILYASFKSPGILLKGLLLQVAILAKKKKLKNPDKFSNIDNIWKTKHKKQVYN